MDTPATLADALADRALTTDASVRATRYYLVERLNDPASGELRDDLTERVKDGAGLIKWLPRTRRFCWRPRSASSRRPGSRMVSGSGSSGSSTTMAARYHGDDQQDVDFLLAADGALPAPPAWRTARASPSTAASEATDSGPDRLVRALALDGDWR